MAHLLRDAGRLCCAGRQLIARRWTTRTSNPGAASRPADPLSGVTPRRGEPDLGHRRIQGELVALGPGWRRASCGKIPHRRASNRRRDDRAWTWKHFLTAQAHTILSCDIFTVDTVFRHTHLRTVLPRGSDSPGSTSSGPPRIRPARGDPASEEPSGASAPTGYSLPAKARDQPPYPTTRPTTTNTATSIGGISGQPTQRSEVTGLTTTKVQRRPILGG